MRSTGTPTGASAASIATSALWSRLALAPGATRTAAGAAFMASRHQDAAGLGQLEDALAGALVLGPVVRVGGPQQRPETLLHLVRIGAQIRTEAHDLQRPPLVGGEPPPRGRRRFGRIRQVGD